jgi:hypothetical protein
MGKIFPIQNTFGSFSIEAKPNKVYFLKNLIWLKNSQILNKK